MRFKLDLQFFGGRGGGSRVGGKGTGGGSRGAGGKITHEKYANGDGDYYENSNGKSVSILKNSDDFNEYKYGKKTVYEFTIGTDTKNRKIFADKKSALDEMKKVLSE